MNVRLQTFIKQGVQIPPHLKLEFALCRYLRSHSKEIEGRRVDALSQNIFSLDVRRRVALDEGQCRGE